MKQEEVFKIVKEVLVKKFDVEKDRWTWQQVLGIPNNRVMELDMKVTLALAKAIAKDTSTSKAVAECLKQAENLEELVYMLVCCEKGIHMLTWVTSMFVDIIHELNEFEGRLAWNVEAIKALIASIERG